MSDQIVSSGFKHVDKLHPCQICGKTDWCRYTEDGAVQDCYREDGHGAREKIDKGGSSYWRHGTPSKLVERTLDHENRAETSPHTIAVRDVAYRAMLDDLALDAAHQPFEEAELLGYRTCPGAAGEVKAGARIYRAIGAESGLDVLKIPGIQIRKIEVEGKEVERVTIVPWEGHYLPCHDHLGRIAALMVRRDDDPTLKPGARTTGKYVWFRGDQQGSAAGQVPHVPTIARKIREEKGEGTTPANEVIRITEGIKKADVGTLRSPILTIAYPTATSWKLAWGPLQDITNDLGHGKERQIVRHAPDADARTNKAVCSGIVNAISHCIIMGRTPELEVWNPKLGKGLDDVLLAHGESVIEVVRGARMFDVLIEWCQSSGLPVPEELLSRALLFKVEADLESNPDRVLDLEVAHAMVVLSAYTDMSDTLMRITEVGSLRGRKTKFENNLKEAQRLKKEEAKAKKLEAAQAKAREKGLPIFEVGDHVEISRKLREKIPGAVFDDGALHAYGSKNGRWIKIPESVLYREVEGYSGAPVRTKPLKIKKSDIEGSIAITNQVLTKEGFFASAPAGFAFRNGFVRVDKEGVHVESLTPEHRVRTAYDIDYDTEAECPRFDKFLREVMSPKVEYPLDANQKTEVDAETDARIDYFLEFVGLSLVGKAPQYAQKSLIFLGNGRNGKSTCTDIIRGVIPPELVCSVSPHSWSNEQSRDLLVGKRLNIVGEIPNREMADTSTYKNIITAEDPVEVKVVHKRKFNAFLQAGHLFLGNEMFVSGDATRGFMERHAFIMFEHTYLKPDSKLGGRKQNRSLAKEILATERAGIIRRVMDAAQRAIARGTICPEPASSFTAVNEWKTMSDPVRMWLATQCSGTCAWDNMPATTPKEHVAGLHFEFNSWAERDKRRGLSHHTFEMRLNRAIKDLAEEDLQKTKTERFFQGDDDALRRIARDGVLRRKIADSSVRRHPILTMRQAEEAELDRRLSLV